MVHAMMIGYSRETVRDRVRFSVSPISAVFLSISLLGRSVSLSFFFTSYLFTPFLFRFSVFAYGHLPGVPAGPAVMLQIPCNPDPHFSNHSLFPYRRVSYSCP